MNLDQLQRPTAGGSEGGATLLVSMAASRLNKEAPTVKNDEINAILGQRGSAVLVLACFGLNAMGDESSAYQEMRGYPDPREDGAALSDAVCRVRASNRCSAQR